MNKTVYLIGTIDSGTDLGRNWRQQFKPPLEKLGLRVIDPTEGFDAKAIDIQKQKVDKAKSSQDWKMFTQLMDQVWQHNETWVKQSDFLIAHFTHSPDKWGGGTTREMQLAFEQKKPVYLVYDGDVSLIKNQLLHLFIKYGRIFKSFDELVQFLKIQRVSG